MAEEDKAAEDLKNAIMRVAALPRASIRQEILLNALRLIARKTGIKIEDNS